MKVATWQGEGRFTIDAAPEPVAHLTVSDTGIGIPTEQIAELFQPFSRLRNAPAESFGGLGLGLYISRDIVERHGGTLTLESAPGRGTTVRVGLPVEQAVIARAA